MPQRPGEDAPVNAPLGCADGVTQVEEPLPVYEEVPGYDEDSPEAPNERSEQPAGNSH